jgi:iron complex outermembrane receptor protein
MRRFLFALTLLAVARPAAGQQKDSAQALPRVTVTEKRTGKDPLRTPLATTTIRAEDWSARLGAGLADALNLAPGVLAQSRSGGMDTRIIIRGFGARGAGDRSNSGTTRGVRYLIDGIPETEPDGRTSLDDIDLWGASSVEVVRSNASALWGNASGGLVNVTTMPGANAAGTTVRTLFGSYGYQRNMIQAVSNAGAGRIFATAVTTKYDGYRGNAQNERQLLTAGFAAPISPATDLGVFLVGASNLINIPGPLSDAQFAADPSQPNATYAARGERRFNRLARLGATVEHRIDDAQDISAMVYVNPKVLQRSERGTYRDFTRIHAGANANYAIRGELTEGVTHTFSSGFDYAFQDGAIMFYSLSASLGRGNTLQQNKREGASNLGLYVQEQVDWKQWGLTLGLRNDNVTYDYQTFVPTSPLVAASKTFSGIVPKLGLTYRFNDRHNIYVNVGGGIEVPAGNETDPAGTFGQDTVTAINPLLEPIRSVTYEVGTRHALGAVKLGPLSLDSFDYDAALYYIDVSNEIVPYRGGRFYFTAGKARRMGVELGVRTRTSFGLGITGAASISDNRYTDYAVDSVHYGKPGAIARYNDNRIVGIPRWFGNLQADYAIPAVPSLSVAFGVQATGGYFVDDANKTGVPAYGVFNLAVRSSDLATVDNVTIAGSLSVENLFDRKYVGSAYLNPDVVGGVPLYIESGMPRMLMLTFELRRK